MLNWTNAGMAGMMPWILCHPDEPAAEQLRKRYGHGGGYAPSKQNWSFEDCDRDAFGNRGKFKQLVWRPHPDDDAPNDDDPEYSLEWCRSESNIEQFFLMDSAWLVVVNKANGEFSVTRVD